MDRRPYSRYNRYPKRRRRYARARQYVPRYRGRGDYFGEFGRSALQGGGSAIGATLGSGFGPVGGILGGALGSTLGSGIADIAGLGDYTIRKNDLLKVDEGMQVGSFGDLNHGIVVCHREYIGDITQTTAFTINTYPINPGSGKTFPWLSSIASNFDQYEIQGMLFHFKSTASDFGTTTNMAMGTVIMATDYDSADNAYASKIEMENAQYSTSCKPSVDCLHAIECDPSITFSPLKYIRTGPVPSGKDPRLYDQGNFYLATTGMPTDGGVIGELWVTYKIAFFKPQLNGGVDVLTDYWLTGGSDATHYWGLTPIAVSTNSLGTTISGNVLTFPSTVVPGTYYLIQMESEGNATAVSPPGNTPVGMTVIKNVATIGTVARYYHTFVVKVTAPSATLTIQGGGTLPAVPVLGFMTVTQLDTEVGPLIN